MELWQLRTFSAVAKNLHFTRAAEQLNLSQPAVSHQIKLLETEIGEPLFLREKEGIFLTKAGQTMYEHANKILDIAEEMKQEINESKDVLSGQIILGVVTQGLGNPFPLVYEKYKKKYPEIDIIFQREQSIAGAIENVKNGSLDITLLPGGLDLSGLVEIPYGEYELLLVVGKNHRLAKKNKIEIADLQNEEWVMFETGSRIRAIFDAHLANAGISPKSIYQSNDGSLVRTMAANSNRISLLPEWGIFEELQNGKLVSIKVKELEYKVQVNVVWKESRRTKEMTAVLNYMLQEKLEGIKLESEKT